MQDCFRLHPEVYGEELDEDEAPAEGTPEIATEKSAAKTSHGENGAVAKVEETIPAKKSAKADAETAEVVKEAEKQNVPPAQP